jgi:hypothetical protein
MFSTLRNAIAAGATLVAMTANSGAFAEIRAFHINNVSDKTITHFYATNTGSNYWGPDLLGENIVPPAYSIVIDPSDGSSACNFDFKTVFSDGTSIVRPNVDVCALEQYTINN